MKTSIFDLVLFISDLLHPRNRFKIAAIFRPRNKSGMNDIEVFVRPA